MEKLKKSWALTLEARSANLEQAISFVTEKLEAADCPLKIQMQIEVAVEELFVNVASYAYASGSGSVTIDLEIAEEPAAAVITFTDSGIPFDPLKKSDPDIALSAEERQIGGLGIFMVKKSMDDIVYERRDGRNILRITKFFSGSARK